MKPSFFLLCIMLGAFVISACQAEVLTFEDLRLSPPDYIGNFPDNPYHGLYWNNNFDVVNGLSFASRYGSNGYFFGMVSISNVVTRGGAAPMEVHSQTTNFNFLSVYLTGVFNSNLNIEVQGFSGTNLLYDQTVIASATNSTLFNFNYLNIDRVVFDSFGGDIAFTNGSGARFAMDNFSFEFVPEPSTLLLTGVGTVLLCAFLKRKRV